MIMKMPKQSVMCMFYLLLGKLIQPGLIMPSLTLMMNYMKN